MGAVVKLTHPAIPASVDQPFAVDESAVAAWAVSGWVPAKGEADGLDDKTAAELRVVATDEGVDLAGARSNEAVAAAIRKHRTASASEA